MEAQWYQLHQALNGNLEAISQIQEPFFLRLKRVLDDPKSGPADRGKACQDALRCAMVHDIQEVSLQLPDMALSDIEMSQAGLHCESLTGRIVLIEKNLSTEEIAVYKRVQRRHLVKAKMDVALSKALNNNDNYTHYNGLGQQVAVRAALTSPEESTLIINLPTGCGKTLVIHALMLMGPMHRLVLVIVPTIGLAIEQADRAKALLKQVDQDHGGYYAWYGDQREDERREIRERLNSSTQRVLFCSPESVTGALLPVLFRLAQGGQLGCVIVDEAHLVDHWGGEFRPEFQVLSPLFHSLQSLSIRGIKKILMSATIGPSTLQTLRDLFVRPGGQAIEINGSFLRPEPNYHVMRASNKQEHQTKVLEAIWNMPRPLILYTTTVDEAKNWFSILRDMGFRRVGLFYGDTPTNERKELIKQWRDEQIDVMVATSAFGVGMDKADVRSVLHAAVPDNLDRFYQEAGRGGRDGNASLSWLIYHQQQLEDAKKLSREKLITIELGLDRWQHLHHSAQEMDSGFLRVSLSVQRYAISRESEQNKAWNWRTLLLMQRAGLIRLHFTPPCPPQRQNHISDQAFKQAINTYNQDYFNHIDVDILHDGHLSQAVWDEKVGLRRQQEKRARGHAFGELTRWLADPKKPLCELLLSFYTENGYEPEPACGGCPGCRHNDREPHTPTLGYAKNVRGWSSISTKQTSIPQTGVLRVRYADRSSPRMLISGWKHWINYLLQTGVIQAIRARNDVLELLKTTLPSGAQYFWCALDNFEEESLWAELILLMPDETNLPAISFRDKLTILVAPESLPDPWASYRRWWECDPNSMALEHFCRRVNYVNN